nr:lysozyme downstream ORF [Colitis phage]
YEEHSMLKSILDHNADALAALAKTEDPGARAIIADTINHAGVFDAKLPSVPERKPVESATVTITPESSQLTGRLLLLLPSCPLTRLTRQGSGCLQTLPVQK